MKLHVLITSGGTREPIDGVRFITNFSTGKTGAFLTNFFRAHGHDVTFLRGKGSEKATAPGLDIEFTMYSDLKDQLRGLLAEVQFDAVIQLAAVSDFSVDWVEINGTRLKPEVFGKLRSDVDSISVHFKRNEKLISKLKAWAKDSSFVLIGFKLTNSDSPTEQKEAVGRLARTDDIDFIVHNNLTEIQGDSHVARIYQIIKGADSESGKPNLVPVDKHDVSSYNTNCLLAVNTKQQLAESLEKLILQSRNLEAQ